MAIPDLFSVASCITDYAADVILSGDSRCAGTVKDSSSKFACEFACDTADSVARVGVGAGAGHFRPDSTICYSASAFACDTADFAARAGDGHIRSDSTTCYGIFRFIRCSL